MTCVAQAVSFPLTESSILRGEACNGYYQPRSKETMLAHYLLVCIVIVFVVQYSLFGDHCAVLHSLAVFQTFVWNERSKYRHKNITS